MVIWAFLLFLGIGFGLLAIRVSTDQEEAVKILSDYPIGVSFLGIIILSNLLFCISIIASLRFYHLLILGAVCILLLFLTIKIEMLISALSDFVKINIYLVFFSSILSFFFINHDYGDTCDMITYHVQMSRYLHLYGLIKGMALISAQLGHVSSWFALPATFEDVLGIYSAFAVGGFTVFLSFFQLVFSFFHIRKDYYQVFLFSYFSLSIPYLFIQVQPTSVENALNAVTGFAFFHAIKHLDNIAELKSNGRKLIIPIKDGHFWMTIIIAASSLSLKLTGLPIFLLSIYMILIHIKILLRYNLHFYFFLISLIFIAPRIGASALASGCPFYPSSLFHLSAPWFVGTEFCEELVKYILAHARWDSEKAPPIKSFLDGVIIWSKTYGGQIVIYLLLFMAITSSISIFLSTRNFPLIFSRYKFLILIQLIGLLYILLSAPNSRFTPPYIMVIFSTFLVFLAHEHLKGALFAILLSFSLSELILVGVKIGLMYVALFVLLIAYSHFAAEAYSSRALALGCSVKVISAVFYFLPFSFILKTSRHPLLAPNVSSFEKTFTTESIHGITYYIPENSRGCGYSPLPCVTRYRHHFDIPLENIRLLNSSKGVAGGFMRVPGDKAPAPNKE